MKADLLERLQKIGEHDPHVHAGVGFIVAARDPERIAEVLVEVIASLSADRARLLEMAIAMEERRPPATIRLPVGEATGLAREMLAAQQAIDASLYRRTADRPVCNRCDAGMAEARCTCSSNEGCR